MKLLQKILLAVLLSSGCVKFSKATQYTIEAINFQFTQPFDSILVGDTVKWVWVEGNHTTSSNGIPPGAEAWTKPLDEQNTSYTYVVLFSGTYNYISVPDGPLMGGKFVASWPTGISNPSVAISNFNIIGNPLRSNIQFQFTLTQPLSGLTATDRVVDVSLYNILGTKIQTLYRGNIPSGEFHESVSLSSNISNGIYFVTLEIGDATLTKRVVVQ
ncbi:MAG TPA: T9SS type A sorting domain-containing protein [Chitinophagales bacterium]|nr:T9SS type A sorting domain-containing protein [Chitinophagales bacterium]